MSSTANTTISDHIPPSLFENDITSAGFGHVPEGCMMKQGSDVVPWDNQHTLIPRQVYVTVNFAISGICLPLCFLVSFCTNLLSMVVFYQQGLKERVNLCLFSLSVLDLLYVAVAYGVHASMPYLFFAGKEDTLDASRIFFFKTHLIGLLSSGQGSQVVSAAVALDRCLCITRPLMVKNFMSTKKTAMMLWSLLLIVVASGFVIDGFRLKVVCVFDVRDNSTNFQFFPTQFYMQNIQMLSVLGGVVFGTGLPTFCGACVTVCTVIIVVKMRKLSQWRETVSSASDSLSSRDLALTRMIVGTSVLFIVCMIPTIAVRVAVNLVPGLSPGGRYENLFLVLARVFYLATAVNCSVNFFAYYAFGSRFRQTVHQLCSCCIRHKGRMDDKSKSDD